MKFSVSDTKVNKTKNRPPVISGGLSCDLLTDASLILHILCIKSVNGRYADSENLTDVIHNQTSILSPSIGPFL